MELRRRRDEPLHNTRASKLRQHEFIAEADHARLVKEARLASRGTSVPARQRLIWLRDAAGSFAAPLMACAGAQAGGH